MGMTPALMLFALLGAHFYFDYAGQGEFMALGKNSTKPIVGVPFWQPLIAHATIHGAAVALITGIPVLGLGEAIIHGITDHLKCNRKISFNVDQAVHIVCKLLWATIATTVT